MNKVVEQIRNKAYCDPNRRMEFVLYFDVKDGNPNGDPDAGNLPRIDPQTRHGIVTDVCVKRKIRDYLSCVFNRPIYIQSQAALNSLYFAAARKVKGYDHQTDTQSSKEEKARKLDAAKSVQTLMVELNSCDNPEFRTLITVSESGTENAKENKKELNEAHAASQTEASEGPANFCEWLSSVEVDGLDFDAMNGTLTYLGEAESKKDFQDLLQQKDSGYEPFKTQIAVLADVLARKKKGGANAKQREARQAVKEKMCELYDDIRLFGAVLTAGTNAGQIRGPMQFTFARSLEPILPWDAAITRCAITKASDWLKKQTEFGRKPWVNYAAYRQHGFYSAMLGKITGVTRDDLARFWIAIAGMFREAKSASNGEMATQELVVFVHRSERGIMPSHKLLDSVKHNRLAPKDNDTGTDMHRNQTPINWSYVVQVENEKKIEQIGVEIHRPLKDVWGDF